FWLGKAQAGTADPEDTDAFQAILARARGSLRRSADKFQPLPSTDPETARLNRVRRGEALLELAEVHLRANQTRDAAGIFNQVALERLLPGQEEEVLQRQLTAHNLAGEYAESDKLCAQFQTSYPRSPLLPEAL